MEKGAIENYYKTSVDNHYQISDANKTNYYLQELSAIETMDVASIEGNYNGLVSHLDCICGTIEINSDKTLSRKLGNWIHQVQSVLKANPGLNSDQLIKYPEVDWEHYNRIIHITELSNTGSGFCCKFTILRNLTDNVGKEYLFDENTVAANFSV